ncbi:PREDICTED: bolA-like protein 3 [Rhagoletis zephyria]|uniref:bolA-like protein 3 n=1 Tax=Rhagoletis zephyria TaxID=28612 RepID=UPI0008117F97|nr:PREDICTED: bolA-like protein 3 [Rhagoletis zephyria]
MNLKREIKFLLPRFFSAAQQNGAQQRILQLLSGRFPEANVNVVDVSGGCGAMFEVFVEAKEFEGLSTLKQHKLITQTLKEQIKDMHGVRIHTSIPKPK